MSVRMNLRKQSPFWIVQRRFIQEIGYVYIGWVIKTNRRIRYWENNEKEEVIARNE